jgi:sialate O-acetylesterase
MHSTRTAIAVIIALATTITTRADEPLRLAGIFSDHMVLQRDRPVVLWGWAEQGAIVSVRFADQQSQTQASPDGTWSVTLQPLSANSQGTTLQVDCGDQSITIDDIMVGEVWHASGQSNMAMTVGDMASELPAVRADIEAADLPMIRFCRIDDAQSIQPLADLRQSSSWVSCDSTSVARFSGAAFYFARALQQALQVPIGIIDSSRGGTPIEPFIPRAAFDSHPVLRQELELGDREDLDGIWKMPGGVRARDANWLPARLFHSRLAPVQRFAVRGAIWYQGESNCGDGEDPRAYEHKMRALITGWRNAFQDQHMPVYFVQLPGSGAGPGWPYLREQQRLAANLPHTGMVVTIDLEGSGIHPANKIDVGNRLARWALAHEYGKQIAYSGPLFDRQEIQRNSIVVHFQHADTGLMIATKQGLDPPHEAPQLALANFEIADAAGTWHPATARIDGNTVIVTSDTAVAPMAVRYAYSMSPTNCRLYGRSGLPAAPFCSRPEMLEYEP